MIIFVLENKECPSGKQSKEEKDQDNLESPDCKSSPPASQNNEQGSTLRDLLTTTAGKLRLGSTDAGIAFAPVYSTGTAVSVYKMHSFSLRIWKYLSVCFGMLQLEKSDRCIALSTHL